MAEWIKKYDLTIWYLSETDYRVKDPNSLKVKIWKYGIRYAMQTVSKTTYSMAVLISDKTDIKTKIIKREKDIL